MGWDGSLRRFPEVDLGARLPAAADGALPQWLPWQPRSAVIPRVRLTELLRLYVCGLQPRPSVQLSSSMVIANDNEYSSERSLRPLVFLLFVRWLNFRFGLDQSYESLVVPFSQPESSYGVGQLSIHQPTVDCTL